MEPLKGRPEAKIFRHSNVEGFSFICQELRISDVSPFQTKNRKETERKTRCIGERRKEKKGNRRTVPILL